MNQEDMARAKRSGHIIKMTRDNIDRIALD